MLLGHVVEEDVKPTRVPAKRHRDRDPKLLAPFRKIVKSVQRCPRCGWHVPQRFKVVVDGHMVIGITKISLRIACPDCDYEWFETDLQGKP